MRIALDGGALSNNSHIHYGNFTVTSELLKALFGIDSKNTYDIYTIDRFEIAGAPKNFNFIQLSPTRGWMSVRVSAQLALTRPDVFLAINQALPLYMTGKVISLSHGLSFMKYPEFYPDSAAKMTRHITAMYKKSSSVVVSSQKVKDDFKTYLGDNAKVHVIPFGIPSVFKEKSLRYKRKKIILYVGMGHPIKQLSVVIHTFERLIKDPLYSTYLLLLVGVSKEYYNSLTTPPVLSKRIMVVPHAEPSELIKFYNEASVVVSASLYESFNLPLLEALSQGTPVAASESAIIPEMKKYVTVSNNLMSSIKKSLASGPAAHSSELHKKFSWNNFAAELIKLYE